MKPIKLRRLISLISGIFLSIFGLILITAYIINAYYERIGDPDQSLLFWYLPILFLGIIILGFGLWLAIREFAKLTKSDKTNFPNRK
jgi:hypothetical protein